MRAFVMKDGMPVPATVEEPMLLGPEHLPLSILVDSDGFQEDVRSWAERNFDTPQCPTCRSALLLLGVMEELGEVARIELKRAQGIRFTDEEADEQTQAEVGDVLVYLANYCAKRGFSMAQAVNRKWSEVRRRNWTRDPRRGGQG